MREGRDLVPLVAGAGILGSGLQGERLAHHCASTFERIDERRPSRPMMVGFMALSLAAFDTEDLAVISAHLQDARLTLSNVAYLRKRMRFVMVFHRKCREAPPDIDGRCHSGLHFERVLAARHIGFDPSEKERALVLLAITFDDTTAPAGTVMLHFMGGEVIRLEVECLEALMKDLDEVMPAALGAGGA